MASPTIIGTTKGTFGVSQTITGLVFESVDYDYKNESVPFPDQNSCTTAVAYFNESIGISLKGYMVSGTSWTGTLASTMSLSGIPAHLKAGNSGGTTVIDSIKISQSLKDWQKIEIGATYFANVV